MIKLEILSQLAEPPPPSPLPRVCWDTIHYILNILMFILRFKLSFHCFGIFDVFLVWLILNVKFVSVNFDQTWYSVSPYEAQQSQFKYFLSIWLCVSLNVIGINFKLQVIYISDIYTVVLHLGWYWRKRYLSTKKKYYSPMDKLIVNENNITHSL